MWRASVMAIILGTGVARADAIDVASRITAVTVFPRGAEVLREGEITLPAGAHTAIIAGLPGDIVENSIRVEGDGAGAQIGAVDSRRVVTKRPAPSGEEAGPDEAERSRLTRELDALRDARAEAQGRIDAANAQRDLALNLTRLPTGDGPWWPLARGQGAAQPEGGAPGTPPGGPAAGWDPLFDLIGTRVALAAKAVQDGVVAQRALDERIRIIEARLALSPPEHWEATELTIAIEAGAPVIARLRVRYQTAAAGWTPVYDARLTTAAPGRESSIALARRAEIEQSTGEDWNAVRLTLSTTRPGGATTVPDLLPLKADIPPPAPPPVAAAAPAARMRSLAQDSAEAAGDMPRYAMQKMEERLAQVEALPYQATFTLQQPANVASGVGARRVAIASETIRPSLMAVSAPAKDTAAYLTAKFIYDNAVPLLPGPVALYRDGVYVGQGAFPLVARGEERELGFGPDDAITVTRVELKRAKGESGLISTTSTDTQQFKITVRNGHAVPRPVTIIDRVPISQDERIAVEMLPGTTEPSTRNRDDKPGVLAWMMELKPGEEREIMLGYQLRWPAKQPIRVEER